MPGEDALQREGFQEVERNKGHLSVDMGSERHDADYDAINYIHVGGTIGYTAVTVQGDTQYFFVSVTARGLLYTVPPLGAELGDELSHHGTRILFAPTSKDIKGFLDTHQDALRTESVLIDRMRLMDELRVAPQKIVNLMMEIAKERGEKV